MLRRGVTLSPGLLTGALVVALPIVKGTAYSLYPVAGVALLATLWRHHRRADARRLGGARGRGARARASYSWRLARRLSPSSAAPRGRRVGSGLGDRLGERSARAPARLPRLPVAGVPAPPVVHGAAFRDRRAYRGSRSSWNGDGRAFGWYDVFFPHWVYVVILVAMLAVPLLAVAAARREWAFVRRNSLRPRYCCSCRSRSWRASRRPSTPPARGRFIAEFGRYAFPAIAPLAVLVVASLHAFGRRSMVFAGAGLLVGHARAQLRVAAADADRLLCLSGAWLISRPLRPWDRRDAAGSRGCDGRDPRARRRRAARAHARGA